MIKPEKDTVFYKKLWNLMIPIVLQNLMLALVAVADAFMLGGLDQNYMSADFRKCAMPLLGACLFWGIGFTSYSSFMGHLGTDAAAANSVAAVVRDIICCFSGGIAIPLAAAGTYVLHWPVVVVYACTCIDEVGKIPWVLIHFRKYKWVKDLTR